MTEKAVLTATAVYERLKEENGGELTQPWAKVRAAMEAEKDTREYVAYLPKDLGRAVNRNRKKRKVHGRPPAAMATSGAS